MRYYKKPQIKYIESLPEKIDILSEGEQALIIYDILLSEIPGFKNWLIQFEHSYGVMAGEALKSIKSFPEHFFAISEKIPEVSKKALTVVAVGGGSIGDFAGFFASVYKRGVQLVQVPTTWLAAIDSAHGGKNALNSTVAKNQIGTFYFPESVFIIKSIIAHLPEDQIMSGFGEIIKTAMIAGEPLWSKLPAASESNIDKLWDIMPEVVDQKYKIVAEDPFENSSVRQVLNLGHTVGHVLEKRFDLPHGEAVAQGLHFSLDWSFEKKYLVKLNYETMKNYLSSYFPCIKEKVAEHLTKETTLKLLLTDKKLNLDKKLNFVFLKDIGQPEVEAVNVVDIISKLHQHSWIT